MIINKDRVLNIIIIIMIPLYIYTVVSCNNKPLDLEDHDQDPTENMNPSITENGGKIFLIKDIVTSKAPLVKTISLNGSEDIYSVNISNLKTNDKVIVIGNYNASTTEISSGVLESYIRKDTENLSTKNLSLLNNKLQHTNVNLVSLDKISNDIGNKKYFIHVKLNSTLQEENNPTISLQEDSGEMVAFIYGEYNLNDLFSGKYNESSYPYYLTSYYNKNFNEDSNFSVDSNYKSLQNIDNISLKKGDYIHIVGQTSIDMKSCITPPDSIKYDFTNTLTNNSTQRSNLISSMKRNYIFTNYDTLSISNIYKVDEDGIFSLSSGIKLEEGKECSSGILSKNSSISIYVFRNTPLSNKGSFYYLNTIDSYTSSDVINDGDYRKLSVHSESTKKNEESLLKLRIKNISKQDLLDIKSNFFVYQLEDGKNYQLYSKYDTKCLSNTASVSSSYIGVVFRKVSDFMNSYHNRMNFSNYYSLKLDQSILQQETDECDVSLKFLGYSETGTNPFYLYGMDSIIQHWKYYSN